MLVFRANLSEEFDHVHELRLYRWREFDYPSLDGSTDERHSSETKRECGAALLIGV